ncbi:hypothetical protein HDE_09374 [Halotydeus destructor]|nr:hypothetical protein HDE_09374 [Halotydeus destructor]
MVLLTDLPDHPLIQILGFLEIVNLVRLERVSKLFQTLVTKTFLTLKHFSYSDVAAFKLTLDPVALANRFGPSLETLPLQLFTSLLDNGNLDPTFMQRLAKRFPEISNFELVTDKTIDLLLVFVNETKGKCKLRVLAVVHEVTLANIKDKKALVKFKIKLNLIISQCAEFDKLEVHLRTDQEVFHDTANEASFQQVADDFGLLLLELCSRVKRLKLGGMAGNTLSKYSSKGPVSLQELELETLGDTHAAVQEVVGRCRFAPYVTTFKLRADVTVLPHLMALENLEAIDITTQAAGSLRPKMLDGIYGYGVKLFFLTRGPSLKRAAFLLLNPHQLLPLGVLLSNNCPNLEELSTGVMGCEDLSLLKLPKLTRFIYIIGIVRLLKLDTLVRNNPKLRFITLICYKREILEEIRTYLQERVKLRKKLGRSLYVDVAMVEDLDNGFSLKRGDIVSRYILT